MTIGLLLGRPEVETGLSRNENKGGGQQMGSAAGAIQEEVGLESMTAEDGMEVTPRPNDAKALVAAGEHPRTLWKANLVQSPATKIPRAYQCLI